MQIQKAKLEEIVRDSEGEAFKGEANKDLTYKSALRNAARAVFYRNEAGQDAMFPESAQDKYRVGMISYKLQTKSKVILDSQDVTLLKERIARIYPTELVVRLFDVLEEKSAAEKRAAKENEEDAPAAAS